MALQSRPLPFDDAEWVFELKYDGFRALAVIEHGRAHLISRNGNPFASFADLAKSIAVAVPNPRLTVLDGEVVCLDKKGRPQFRDLLFHRGDPCFFTFDVLVCDGKDWRMETLVDRKQELRRLLGRLPLDSRLRYVEHIDGNGTALFQRVMWRASLPNRSPARTSRIERSAHGSRFATGNTRRWRAVRNCLSVNGTRSRWRDGIMCRGFAALEQAS